MPSLPLYRLLSLVMALVLCLSPGAASAGPYAQSAHGDATAGVKRSNLPAAYTRGNCAHCHEQHASIGGSEPVPASGNASDFALFADGFSDTATGPYTTNDTVCFGCHTAGSSLQSPGTLLNHDYAETFGGYDTGTDEGILEVFNHATGTSPSYNNLEDIQTYAASNFAWFDPNASPCVACHNPHRAKRNKAHPRDPSYTAISRPTDHESLWGDDAGETMADYTSNYQAPYYYNSTTTFEPDGVATSDGGLIPDYVTFCNDCHDKDMPTISSTQLGRDLYMIDWDSLGGDNNTAGDKHGANYRTTPNWLREPYASAYNLSCLDCHEPHGSPNAFLVRRSINGEALSATVNDSGGRGNQCRQCHKDDYLVTGKGDINEWKDQHHGRGQDSPYSGRNNPAPSGGTLDSCDCHGASEGSDGKANGVTPIDCEICHHHGSYVPNPNGQWPATVTPKNVPASGYLKTF